MNVSYFTPIANPVVLTKIKNKQQYQVALFSLIFFLLALFFLILPFLLVFSWLISIQKRNSTDLKWKSNCLLSYGTLLTMLIVTFFSIAKVLLSKHIICLNLCFSAWLSLCIWVTPVGPSLYCTQMACLFFFFPVTP